MRIYVLVVLCWFVMLCMEIACNQSFVEYKRNELLSVWCVRIGGRLPLVNNEKKIMKQRPKIVVTFYCAFSATLLSFCFPPWSLCVRALSSKGHQKKYTQQNLAYLCLFGRTIFIHIYFVRADKIYGLIKLPSLSVNA